MATRPSSVPTFATDAGTRATLTTTRKATGFLPGEVLLARELNAAIGTNNDWVVYLSELSPLSNVISGNSALTLVGGTADINRTRLQLADEQVIWNQGTTATPNLSVWHVDWLAWVHTRAAQVVTAGSADDGYRFGYSSSQAVIDGALVAATPLELYYYLTDSHGGWSSNTSTASAQYATSTGNVLFVYPASAATYTWYRDLSGVMTGHNAAVKTAGGTVYDLFVFGATLDASTGTDILIELVRQDRSTNSETVVYQLPTSGTPHTGGSASYSESGSETVDLSLYRYYVRATAVGTGSSGVVAVRDLKLTVRKYAVE